MPTQCGMDFNGSPSGGGGQGGDQIFDDVEITQDLEIQGDLTVNGTTTTINTEILTVEDPMVLVGAGNQADLNDAGLIVEYDSSTSSKYAGLVRDKSEASGGGKKFWKLVDNLSSQPGTTNNNTVLYDSNLTDLKVRNLKVSSTILSGSISNDFEILTGSLDKNTSGPLTIGDTFATQVDISKLGANTNIKGNLSVHNSIQGVSVSVQNGQFTTGIRTDEVRANTVDVLRIGDDRATQVDISRTGVITNVKDDLQIGTDPTIVSGVANYAPYGSPFIFSGTANQARLGFDVSAYGDKIAYSAVHESNFMGRVHVRQYDTNTNTWIAYGSFIQGLNNNERIGNSIWLDEKNGITRIAIGGSNVGAGFTRVYEYQSGTWVQLGGDIQGINSGDKEGDAVSLNGNLLATVAKEHDNGTDLGMCRVFEWDGVSWTQKGQTIFGPGGGWPNYHLDDCILTNNHLFISDFSTNSNTGKVDAYTFDSNSGQWVQKGQSLSGTSAYHKFGEQISAYEDDNTLRLVIGEPIDYGNSARWVFPGKAYIYDWGGTQWNLTQTLTGDAGRDGFGYSIGVFANRLVVGTRDSNYAKVYTLQSGTWTQVGGNIQGVGLVGRANITLPPTGTQQLLGNAVAVYDTTIILGDYLSPLITTDGGTVEIYQLTNIAPFSAFSINDKHRVYGSMGSTGVLTAYDDLKVKQDIDVISSGSLNIGSTVASGVNISKAGDTTTVKGALKVDEKITALNFGDDARRNLFIGRITDPAPTGFDNISIGDTTGDAITSGSSNVLIGNLAGSALQTDNNSVFIGKSAGRFTNGPIGGNVGVGVNSCGGTATAAQSGEKNLAFGTNALRFLQSGKFNVALGDSTLNNITSGDYNVDIGVGFNTGISNTNRKLRIGVHDGVNNQELITGQFDAGTLNLGRAVGTSIVNILSNGTNPFTVNTVNQDVKRDVYGQIRIPSIEQTSITLASNTTYDINSTTFTLFGQGLTPYPYVEASNGLQQTNPLAYHFSLTVSDAGWYEVNANMNSYPDSKDGMLLILGLRKNGSLTDFASVSLKVRERYTNQTISCLIQCVANDVLSLYLRNEGDADVIKVKHMNMTVKRLRTSY